MEKSFGESNISNFRAIIKLMDNLARFLKFAHAVIPIGSPLVEHPMLKPGIGIPTRNHAAEVLTHMAKDLWEAGAHLDLLNYVDKLIHGLRDGSSHQTLLDDGLLWRIREILLPNEKELHVTTQPATTFPIDWNDDVTSWEALTSGAYLAGRGISKLEGLLERIGTISDPLGDRDALTEVGVSTHRETGKRVRYLVTPLQRKTLLKPAILHCECDALALAKWLIRSGKRHVQVMEIRSSGLPLVHVHSIWPEPMSIYEFGVHYAVLVDGKVYDLQSGLEEPLPTQIYLESSFPHQVVQTSTYYPNELRRILRESRDYRGAKHNGFRLFPELRHDPWEPEPPRSPLRTLVEVITSRRKDLSLHPITPIS